MLGIVDLVIHDNGARLYVFDRERILLLDGSMRQGRQLGVSSLGGDHAICGVVRDDAERLS